MNAYMCGGKHGRQSHATSRIRLTYVNRTVLDGHVLGAFRGISRHDVQLNCGIDFFLGKVKGQRSRKKSVNLENVLM